MIPMLIPGRALTQGLSHLVAMFVLPCGYAVI